MARKRSPKFLLSIKDLMRIRGLNRYNSAQKEHQAIRDVLTQGETHKKYLTVREYCDYTGLPYSEVQDFLCGESTHPANSLGEAA